jgi:cell division protein FtsQ
MARKNRRLIAPEKKKQRRRRRLRSWLLGPLRLLGLAVVGMAIGLGAYQVAVFLRTSPALSVRQIEIRGLERTGAKELLQAVGLEEGINIFSVKVDDVRRRAERLPWIRSARAERIVPDRIVIEVKEQEAAATINLDGLYYVNTSGEVFKRALPQEGIDLPIITGISRQNYENDRLRVQVQISVLLHIIDKLRELSCLSGRSIAEMHFDELMGPSAILDPGALTVRFERDTENDAADLCRVLDQMKRYKLRARTILMSRSRGRVKATIRLEKNGTLAVSDSHKTKLVNE